MDKVLEMCKVLMHNYYACEVKKRRAEELGESERVMSFIHKRDAYREALYEMVEIWGEDVFYKHLGFEMWDYSDAFVCDGGWLEVPVDYPDTRPRYEGDTYIN